MQQSKEILTVGFAFVSVTTGLWVFFYVGYLIGRYKERRLWMTTPLDRIYKLTGFK